MKRITWIILSIIIALAVIIQLIPVNRPAVKVQNQADLLTNVAIPDSVAQLLKTSCYDCHSNQTTYPWYAHVAPVSWLVTRDVREGREHVNFSTWGDLDKKQKAGKLSDIMDEVSGKDMPLAIYPLMHPDAKLSDADRKAIVDWANRYGEQLFK